MSEWFKSRINPTTNIVYQLARSGEVTVKVYNALGREVQILVDEIQQPRHYFLINTNGRVINREVMLIK